MTTSSFGGLHDRPRLGTEVTRVLRNAVLTGEYPAGYRLRIEDLAQKLGVSTMPVREALVTLANEGLLKMLPRRGFEVTPISPQEIEDVFLVHALIAGELAHRAAATIAEPDILSLKEIQAQIEAAGSGFRGRKHLDPPPSDVLWKIEQLNFEFHALISRASDSRRLRWFLRATTRYTPPRFFEIPGWVDASIEGHPGIISALEARDGDLAEKLTIGHFLHGGELVTASYGAGARDESYHRARQGAGTAYARKIKEGQHS